MERSWFSPERPSTVMERAQILCFVPEEQPEALAKALVDFL